MRTEAIAEVIGFNVRSARHAVGLSQDALADAASLQQSNVYEIEAGVTTPTLLSLARVAGALGLEIEDLLDGVQWRPRTRHERGYFVLRERPPGEAP